MTLLRRRGLLALAAAGALMLVPGAGPAAAEPRWDNCEMLADLAHSATDMELGWLAAANSYFNAGNYAAYARANGVAAMYEAQYDRFSRQFDAACM